MPIQHAIWQVGDQPTLLARSKLVSEQQLEDMIVREPSILSSEWMLIGRQETTTHGGRIDLLAIAPDGTLVLIELKRDRTPREFVAQALDYASWVAELTADRIVIVCKDTEVTIVDAVIKQLGLSDRLQGLVTFSDLKNWYRICLSESHRKTLGTTLLQDFIREFTDEFPSLDGLEGFMSKRKYHTVKLSKEWAVAID